jgi:hypothetical protein
MIAASLFNPHLNARHHTREVTSMSDYVHTGRHSKTAASKTFESRLMFATFYLPFLLRAIVMRLMPWRRRTAFGQSAVRESIFREASSDASLLVGSSFLGL